ncbi:hypothetical protein A2W14_01655 [Candidatus Gottesmanbacteria bacterium RBG_16_37_8]|uniref:NlpC/P60 domain-containing protein n=1 Tax=Candidatus Gottesmanbacteria bacterium RBG_16_37_8 TaxID=1798371 RepID=A0A1F5YQS6_9BACT|nr:MAG: hypothetical protein A2W14_01655 [Candidatus Gottesmanbacteria bacterium RBG_16_37_8]
MDNKLDLQKKTQIFVDGFLNMDILGQSFNCPYWSNKMKNGRVVLRGFLDGKGDSKSIKHQLENLILPEINKDQILSNPLLFYKFAKKNRIGIDCSGFVYRILDFLISRGFVKRRINKITGVFKDGIRKTNASALTSNEFNVKVNTAGKVQFADMIRFNGGQHIALIIDKSADILTYVHSSKQLSEKYGVHKASIRITDPSKGLEFQIWQEKTGKGDNFGQKYFRPEIGDGIFRLKAFP